MADGIGSVHVSYADKELLSGGSFITFGDEETVLDIELAGDHLAFVFQVQASPDRPHNNVEQRPLGADRLKVTFFNPTQVYGSGTHVLQPIEVGTIAGRRLWYTVRVTTLSGSKSVDVVYAFYVEKEAAGGHD